MNNEKVDILRRKMISSGLAALATISVVGVANPSKAKAQDKCSSSCYACPSGCYNCQSCQTCQSGNSKGEPEI